MVKILLGDNWLEYYSVGKAINYPYSALETIIAVVIGKEFWLPKGCKAVAILFDTINHFSFECRKSFMILMILIFYES